MGVSRRIEVQIDRLILRGVDAADRDALVRGLKAELERVLADPLVRRGLAQSRRIPVLRLGGLRMEAGLGGARRVGGQIARGIGKGLRP